MIAVLGVLMLPAVATITPLFIFLNQFQIELGDRRRSTCGLAARRDPRGHLRRCCRSRSGTSRATSTRSRRTSRRRPPSTARRRTRSSCKVVLPLATPAIAVTGFLGFLAGWTEYLTVDLFIGDRARTGRCRSRSTAWSAQFARTTHWSEFAAFAILFALPVSLVFFFFQRYLVGGLAVGGVKG